ncbi:hypothetical protein H2509_10100 [Stappia sp. F7233]|uniref:Uncharacterized protein n=1 Tax=Stappia albiluteola TaxID=2758565 RepID=A0A839AB52_9HYPH|nr:hypothetical protein [Stappia albiluteola]MBA5776137.1 hypothetical protein [Stappia albiluteola]MBA5777105.1 hypothetical protein [Stappia albiluteola]MBA5777437.1 hypothetical protein [Stappia albiluteola]MBA5777476.1 hypothetical protein [Stappia albiluteola]
METIEMDAEKLFTLAVGLVEANVRAGQQLNSMNLDTVVRDQVQLAFNALADVWSDIVKGDQATH